MRSDNFSLEFLRRISRRRHSAHHRVESISEYIEWRAAQLTQEHLAGLRTDLPILKIRFTAIVVPQFPHLEQQLKLLCDFFEDTADGVFPAGLMHHERKLLCPSLCGPRSRHHSRFVPEIGYADDSLIVRTVLSRHQDIFRDYCHFRRIGWSKDP